MKFAVAGMLGLTLAAMAKDPPADNEGTLLWMESTTCGTTQRAAKSGERR